MNSQKNQMDLMIDYYLLKCLEKQVKAYKTWISLIGMECYGLEFDFSKEGWLLSIFDIYTNRNYHNQFHWNQS